MAAWVFLQKVAAGWGVGARGVVGHFSLVYYLSAVAACVWAYVDEPVGRSHDLLVVFHHDDGVANDLKLAQHLDETVGVGTV